MQIHKLLLLLLTFLLSAALKAQNFEWAVSMGGPVSAYAPNDAGNSIKTDAAGNIYTTGNFAGVVDFDPGPGVFNLTSTTVPFATDMFIQKLDANGNFVWAKQLTGDSSSAGTSISLDASSNIYITGWFWGTKDFDPGPGVFNITSAGRGDIFVMKLDVNGNFLWAKRYGSDQPDETGRAIAIDNNQNIYVAGIFRGTADFDPGTGIYNLTSAGSVDIFITKLDNAGNFIWAGRIGGTSGDQVFSIALDANGNVYTTGSFDETCDFDPGPGVFNLTAIGSDIFILKLGTTGNFLWVKQMASSTINGSQGYGIVLDNDNNIFYCGYFDGTVDFDPGPGIFSLTANNTDIIISKLDSNGDFVWAKQIGGNTGQFAWAITLDNTANCYITGEYADTVDFDPGPGVHILSSNSRNVYIEKLDSSGNFMNVTTFGGTGDDHGFDITISSNFNIYTTGTYKNTADFDPGPGVFNLTSNGGGDIFIQKLSQCATPITPGAIAGNTSVCSGSSQTYSINPVAGATGYTWTIPSGWTGSSTTNSINTVVGTINGVVQVTASNNCGPSPPQTLAVVVIPLPAQPGAISGNNIICQGSSQTYSIAPVSGATNYTWTLPSGWTGSSTTNSINVSVGPTSGNITVTANNSCGSGPARSLSVIVSIGIPAQPGAINGNNAVCQGSIQTYSIAPVSGATNYTWTLPAGWTGTSISNSITTAVGTTGGNITITASNICGSSPAQTLSVTVNTIPAQPGTISGNNLVCQGSAQTYSISAVSGATSYTWILPSGWTGTSTTNSINATVGANGGNISVTANNACGSGSSQTLAVTINPIPAQPGTIAGNTTVTVGQNINYSIIAVSGATGYNWALSGGGSITSGQNTTGVSINWTTAGNYTLSVNAGNSCGSSSVQNLSVIVSTVTATVDPPNPFQVKIVPNPSEGDFYLMAKGVIHKKIRIEIMNLSGQIVYSKEQKAASNDYSLFLDLHKLSSGVYKAKIFIDKKVYVRSIAKM